jgi:hypothetical protein
VTRYLPVHLSPNAMRFLNAAFSTGVVLTSEDPIDGPAAIREIRKVSGESLKRYGLAEVSEQTNKTLRAFGNGTAVIGIAEDDHLVSPGGAGI